MSIQQKTIKEISDNIVIQLETEFNQTIPLLPKSFCRVLAKVLAGLWTILYKYGGYIHLQQFVDTASDKDTIVNGVLVNPLNFWGNLIGAGERKSATNAELIIDITVTTQIGSLPAYTQLVGLPNGVTYLTIGAVNLDAPTVQATIKASSDQAGGGGAGAIGNLSAGDIVSFANPIGNILQNAVVSSISVTGADEESTEEYRNRIREKFQKRPQGGAPVDYELWGEEAAGIINVYPYKGQPGQVDVYCEADTSIDPDGIPTNAQLEEVLDKINFDDSNKATRRSINAFVNALPISRVGFDVLVIGIEDVDNVAQVQADITEAVTEYILAAEPYIAGVTPLPRKDIITRTAISGLAEDIINAAGGRFLTVSLKFSGEPDNITQYLLGEGEKGKLTSITYPTTA